MELVRDWLDGVGVSGGSDKVMLTRSGAAGEAWWGLQEQSCWRGIPCVCTCPLPLFLSV